MARTLAEDYCHSEVCTAHLLVGILHEESSVGSRVLQELEINPKRASLALQGLYPTVDSLPADPLDLSASLKCALEFAVDEARWLAHHYLGTEHQLLGIVRGGGDQTTHFLREHNVSADQVRRKVRRLVQSGVIEVSLEAARSMARLSELSRRALNAAEYLARASHNELVSLVHLLLVISQEQRSPCHTILSACGFRPHELAASLEEPDHPTGGPLDIILNRAIDETDRLGSSYTGIDHMLLAISLHARGRRILQMFGADPQQVERRVREIIMR
jgi:ATP-dependent Clp protease ATP-binding subunit ClpA